MLRYEASRPILPWKKRQSIVNEKRKEILLCNQDNKEGMKNKNYPKINSSSF